MATKNAQQVPDPDAPNDDAESYSAEEQAALDDRSTVGAARREEEAALVAEQEAAAAPERKVVEQPKLVETKPEEKPPEGAKVPLASLIEERKEWQRKLDEESEKRAQLAGKLDLINQRLNQPKPQEPAKPIDVDANPVEALKQTRQQLEQITQQQQQAFQQQQFAQHVAAQVQDYKRGTPDYDAAYQHLKEGRVTELTAMGYNSTQIAQILQNDEFGISALALQRGENPGAALYKIAQARGYKKAEAAPQQQQQPVVTAEQRIDAANKGQAAAKSLSGGGSPPPAKLTLADIEKMSEDEIAAMPDDKFRALFGA